MFDILWILGKTLELGSGRQDAGVLKTVVMEVTVTTVGDIGEELVPKNVGAEEPHQHLFCKGGKLNVRNLNELRCQISAPSELLRHWQHSRCDACLQLS